MEQPSPPVPSTVPQSNPYQISVSMSAVESSPVFPEMKINRAQGWVTYGEKNLFPQKVLQISGKSPVNDAIIAGTVNYVCGKGVIDGREGVKGYIGAPNNIQTWDNLIEPIALDNKQFGGFYFQVIVNRGSTTVSLFHQDFSQVRIGKVDAAGNPLSFKIAKNWLKTSGVGKPVELEVWPGSISKAKKGTSYIHWFWRYTPGLDFYCIPDWWSAEEYVKADSKLGGFYNNSIDNNFTPSVVFTFPSNPEQDVKDAVQAQLEKNYAGAAGGCAIICLWGEGDKGAQPTATAFNASKNADVYINVETQVFQKIISAHRLSSPTLAGISGAGNLSGNAAEIIDSYILYSYSVIEKQRRTILDEINKFTKINGTAPIVIEDLDVIKKINESKNPSGNILTIQNGNKTVDSLASKIGAGGVAALMAIMSGDLPDDQKRGILTNVFGLSDADIKALFYPKKLTTLEKIVYKWRHL